MRSLIERRMECQGKVVYVAVRTELVSTWLFDSYLRADGVHSNQTGATLSSWTIREQLEHDLREPDRASWTVVAVGRRVESVRPALHALAISLGPPSGPFELGRCGFGAGRVHRAGSENPHVDLR